METKWNEEELIRRVENAAKEGAIQGIKEHGKSGVGGPMGNCKGSFIKFVAVVALVAVLSSVISAMNPFSGLSNMFSKEEDVEGHDLTLENHGFFGYTAADFEEVILGDSTKLKKLEVYSQEMSQMVQLTQAGLGNFKIFTKSKYYTYHGTAIYTVDLSKLKKNCIQLDEETLTVTLTIPHAELTTLDIPQDKMEIGDTQRGVLAFGDLNMTDEQSQEIMAEARKDMTEQLIEDKVQEQADQMAKLAVWEIYQPLIAKTAKGYSLQVEFDTAVAE